MGNVADQISINVSHKRRREKHCFFPQPYLAMKHRQEKQGVGIAKERRKTLNFSV